MAKKKKATNTTSFKEAIGIDKIFHNERLNFFLGFMLLFVAGYLIWAFISYLTTGAADQSMIDAPKEERSSTRTASSRTPAAHWGLTAHGSSSSTASDCRLS